MNCNEFVKFMIIKSSLPYNLVLLYTLMSLLINFRVQNYMKVKLILKVLILTYDIVIIVTIHLLIATFFL